MTDMQKRAQATVRSGGRVIASGIYRLESFDGTPDASGTEATLTRNEHAPPTPSPHLLWGLVRRTRHKGDAPDTPAEPEGQ